MRKPKYKVVAYRCEQLFSCVIADKKWAQIYSPGCWVKAPHNSRLFVFDSLEGAIDFVDEFRAWNEHWEIWECETKGREKELSKVGFSNWGTLKLLLFWAGERNLSTLGETRLPDAQPGTRLYPSVKLTKKVETFLRYT